MHKVYIKDDFMNGAIDTDLTLDDFVIIRPEKEKTWIVLNKVQANNMESALKE